MKQPFVSIPSIIASLLTFAGTPADAQTQLANFTSYFVSEEHQAMHEADTARVYQVVEEMPEFPGGHAAMIKFLADNVYYPLECAENGLQGRVVMKFVVEPDGCLSHIQVVRSLDPPMDRMAMEVIRKMPRWREGRHYGKPVRVEYLVPIRICPQ